MSEPLTTLGETARASQAARAVVMARGVETEYARAGRGEPLVLLVNDIDAAAARALLATLATNYLVYAASPSTERRSSWLQDFMEGLGVVHAHVLVHACDLTSCTRSVSLGSGSR